MFLWFNFDNISISLSIDDIEELEFDEKEFNLFLSITFTAIN